MNIYILLILFNVIYFFLYKSTDKQLTNNQKQLQASKEQSINNQKQLQVSKEHNILLDLLKIIITLLITLFLLISLFMVFMSFLEIIKPVISYTHNGFKNFYNTLLTFYNEILGVFKINDNEKSIICKIIILSSSCIINTLLADIGEALDDTNVT